MIKVDPPVVDIRVDSNRDGVVDVAANTDDQFEESWSADAGAVFLANIDDDNTTCPKSGTDIDLPKCNDAADAIVNGPDDLLDLAVMKVLPWPKAPNGAQGKLDLGDNGDFVRVFRPNGSGGFTPFNLMNDFLTADELRTGVELRIEAKDIVRDRSVWSGVLAVTLSVTTPKANGSPGTPGQWDGGGLYEEVLLTDFVVLRVAPLLTFSHITDVEQMYATNVPSSMDSADYRNGLQAALSFAQIPAPLVSITTAGGPDQWAQDYFETGYMTMPGAGASQHAMRVAIRSANVYSNNASNPLRPAGKVVFTGMRGKNVGAVQQFLRGSATEDTLNSTGNLETIPPYSFNGKNYSVGRQIRGNVSNYHPDQSFLKMMEAQAMQPPVYVDTSWLLVAHIDETISFLPVNSPRGWIMLINDPRLAKTMLEAQVTAGNGNLKMFPGQQTYNAQGTAFVTAERTINQVLADTVVMQDSAKAAAEVDAQLAIIKAETGITDAEIIRVPYLHEPIDGFSVAYMPGTVNGVHLTNSVFASPDPHGVIINGKDHFKEHLENALAPIGYTVKWVEDWYLYHINLGEVHCGSNVTRKIPTAKWWESGR